MPFTIPSALGAGDPATANNALLFSQQALEIENAMKQQGYTKLAADWLTFYPSFHAQYPQYTAFQVESAFIGDEAAKGIAGATSDAGSTLGGIPGAAATGAENAVNTLTNINPLSYLGNIADFFSRLTQGSTWLRVGEVLAGGMLLYIGIHASVSGTGGAIKAGAKSGAGHAQTAFGGGKSFGKLLWEMVVVPK